jgi:hypothetical protein
VIGEAAGGDEALAAAVRRAYPRLPQTALGTDGEPPAIGALVEALGPALDREALRELMDELDVGEDMIKTVFALVAERAGRLKLNGSLTSYSPLSRLVEIEGLLLGVNGKLSLWRALRELDDPRLPDTRLDELERRAERQRDELEDHRLMAAREAFEDG